MRNKGLEIRTDQNALKGVKHRFYNNRDKIYAIESHFC